MASCSHQGLQLVSIEKNHETPMSASPRNTFKKSERLCSRILIDRLFQGESRSVSAYPIRGVIATTEEKEPGISILISVPKKRFHHAVDRNRVKRQIREAYRKHKSQLTEQAMQSNKNLLLAFIYVSDKIENTNHIEKRMVRLLEKISETL
jgi:ribonuclease P protein component